MYRFSVLITLLVFSNYTTAVTIIAQESFTEFEALGLRAGGGNGTLDSTHWQIGGASSGDSSFGDTATSGDFARGLSGGGERVGGLYAFSLPADSRGVGFQATGSDFTPGTLLWVVANQTRQWLSDIVLNFELWWLNDGERSTEIETQVSFDSSNWLSLARTLTPIAADELGWKSAPQALVLGANQHGALKSSSEAQPLAPDAELWFRWRFDDSSGSGSRDEFAITALQVLAQPSVPPGTLPITAHAPSTLWFAILLVILCDLRRHHARRSSQSCNATDTCL